MGRPGQSNGSLAQAGRRSAHALKMTLTSHLGPADAGVQQQHRQESQDSQPRPPAPGARLRRHPDPGRHCCIEQSPRATASTSLLKDNRS
jgi:hypothetical protein